MVLDWVLGLMFKIQYIVLHFQQNGLVRSDLFLSDNQCKRIFYSGLDLKYLFVLLQPLYWGRNV